MVGGGKDREEMSNEHVEKIIMVIERRKQIVNAMRKIIKMLEVLRNEQIDALCDIVKKGGGNERNFI